MTAMPADLTGLPAPEQYSTMCARFLRTHRDLKVWASSYGDLLPASLLEPLCLMHVFHAPWHDPAQLRLHNRMAAWLFALDNMAEAAETQDELDDLLDRCRRVVGGVPPEPHDALARCLADVWAELREVPLWPALEDRWLDLFDRTLEAMRAERRVRAELDAGGTAPTIGEYLANCDNAEVRIAYFTYWLAMGEETLLRHLDTLLAALWEAQVAVRWANDHRSIQRENEESTALNALLLGVEPVEIARRARAAADRCTRILEPLLAASVPEAVVLDRMTRSVVGFYAISDYRPEGRP